MKTGTRLNKVAVLTGGFAFALMAGMSTVNANDQFTTEVESQNSRTKQDYYSQIGQGSPESVKATGAISVQSSTSINDAASNAQNVVNVTAQQVKADADRKIRDLEDRLANAGGGQEPEISTNTIAGYGKSNPYQYCAYASAYDQKDGGCTKYGTRSDTRKCTKTITYINGQVSGESFKVTTGWATGNGNVSGSYFSQCDGTR